MEGLVQNYRIESLIAQNLNKRIEVYLAKNATNQRVVLKTHLTEYPPLKDVVQLEHEFHVLQKLDLKEVVQPIELIHAKNHLYLALEFIEGVTLKAFIQEQTKLDLKTFYIIAIQLVTILDKVHQHKIIHKDFNPTNLMINPKTLNVRLIDFSLASELAYEVSSTKLEGSLDYLSPEQTGRTSRITDFRSDFYSLGITFFEMLTGTIPFKSNDPLELIFLHLTEPPPPISTAPPLLEKLIGKLMAKNAEDRYSSAAGINEDLLRLQRGEGSFELGQDDIKSAFLISQKLYGRNEMVDQILAQFKNFSVKDPSEILLIKGPSGIGKTVLIQIVQKPLIECKGIFIKGKYDILQKDTPFFGLLQAIKELIQILLASENLGEIQEQIFKHVESRGRLLTDLIPEMKLLIKELPPLDRLSSQEEEVRLYLTFRDFFNAIASKEHPLVIFLDDLQGVDQTSMNLIKILVNTTSHIFFIGSYRDNEVSEIHPLTINLKEILRKTTLSVEPLTQRDIEELLQDTLLRQDVGKFAEQVLIKTSGNPFFIVELLKSLYQHELITFESNEWKYDLQKIEQTNISNNVVKLIADKIARLTPACQQVLGLASCIGGVFDLNTLSVASGKEVRETAPLLLEAIQEGLVVTSGSDYKLAEAGENITYRFLHDKVQEAAYEMVEKDKKAIHLQLARYLKEKNQPLFDILDQYNHCLDYITDPQEKSEVANLNLQAAKKAKASHAYPTALSYLKAYRLLQTGENFEVEKELGACLSLIGEYEQAEKQLLPLFKKASSPLDRLELYSILTDQYFRTSNFAVALEYCLKGFKEAGIDLPPSPALWTVFLVFVRFNIILLFKNKESLKNLSKRHEDEQLFFVNKLFSVFGVLCYITENQYLRFIGELEVILDSLKHGYTGIAAISYLAHSNFLIYFNWFKKAVFWKDLAFFTADKIHSTVLHGRIRAICGYGYSHWFQPLSKSIELNEEANKYLLDAGDSIYLLLSYNFAAINTFLLGKSLSETFQAFTRTELASHGKQHLTIKSYKAIIISLQNEGEVVNELLEKNLERVKDTSARFVIRVFYSTLLFINGEFSHAFKMTKEAEKISQSLSLLYFQTYSFYLYAVTAFEHYETLTSKEKRKLHHTIKQFKIWAKQCPQNYEAMYRHLMAESEARRGNHLQATNHFQAALDSAESMENHLFAALISEGAFRYLTKMKQSRFAKTYLQIAYHHYSRWGALAKTKQLEIAYPELIAEKEGFSRETSLVTSSTQSLDFASIVKATEAVSSELFLGKLFNKLIKIVRENAGAQRVVIVIEHGGELYIDAEGGPEGVKIHQGNLAKNETVPLSIINYVFRTKQPIVLHDASKNPGQFQQDAYLSQQSVKSLLCIPILHHAVILGVIYLENNLTTQAFTEDRVKVLNVLSTQTAISMENARIEELNNELNKALEKLKQSQLQLIQAEKMASLGQLTAGISHEINTPAGAIINSISGMKQENATFLRDSLKIINGLPTELINPFLEVCDYVSNLPKEQGTKEIRKSAKIIESKLSGKNIENARMFSYNLATAGFDENSIQLLEPFFQLENSQELCKILFTIGTNRVQMGVIEVGIQKIARLVKALKLYSRSEVDQLGLTDLREDIEVTLSILHSRLSQGITVETNYEEIPKVKCYADQLNQVWTNILNNAIEAMKGRGVIKITVKQHDAKHVLVEFENNGPMMRKEVLSRLFEPYFTTKAKGEGTGLGLAISKDIIYKHHGKIIVSSLPEGTSFKFVLPINVSESSADEFEIIFD